MGDAERRPGGHGGLYDGFEGYRTPTDEDRHAVLAQGLVVVDTNVLLNLYRYTRQARDDLLTVLERLGDRLWVPHQVLTEFWRNREAVLRDPRASKQTIKSLEQGRDAAVGDFRRWAKRVSMPEARSRAIVEALKDGFATAIAGIEESDDATEAAAAVRDTAADPVLRRLDALLAGRVGAALDETLHAAAVAEGRRRAKHGIPPGYKDSPGDDGEPGDHLVWEQLLVEATRRGRDVAFVTGDVKEDWWRHDARREPRGPRPELVEELRHRAGVRLFMLTPPEFLTVAKAALGVTVRKASVATAEEVDRLALAHPDEAERLRYWRDYLTPDGSRLLQAAATLQRHLDRSFTLRELAEAMSVTVETVRRYREELLRSDARWRQETNTRAPFRLIRTIRRLGDGDGLSVRYALAADVVELLAGRPFLPEALEPVFE